MVTLEKVEKVNIQPKGPRHLDQPDEIILKNLISKHQELTDSPIALDILNEWETQLDYFVKVMPLEYKRALDEIHAATIKEVA